MIGQEAFFSDKRGLSFEAVLRLLAPPVLIAIICVTAGRVHYLLFHTLAEFFSIIIAVTALVVATTSRRFTHNHFTVYVAVAVGWCAALDLIHTVTYKGMHLAPVDEANTATQFWIAARFMQAAALLGSPLLLRRTVRIGGLHLGFGLVAVAVAGWIFSGHFPAAFVEGQGLTPFKIYAEYVIIAMLLGTSMLYGWQRRLMSAGLFLSMQAALVAMIVSEFAFTRYANVYGLTNEIGHVAKIFAYWFVYLGLVESTLREPFSMLSRTASTYDAVPDPALVVGDDGLIRQANEAAARHAGLSEAALLGSPVHSLFHDPGVVATECPVCARIARGETSFSVEIDRGSAGTVECTVAPFMTEDRTRSFVQVVRDVTEHKRLLAERESLVGTLGERVKELRCQYAVAEILAQPGIEIPALLAQVVEALPPGFLYPTLARAAISGDWGDFGAVGADQARYCLSRDLLVNGRRVGTVRVFYAPQLQRALSPFLAEEQALLDTVAGRIGEAIERIQAGRQVRRLTYLYDMLSATNRSIVRCRTNDELLARVFDALILHSAYPILFIATTDTGDLPFRVVHSHGIERNRLNDLQAVIADPQSAFGLAVETYRKGHVVWTRLEQMKSSHVRWHQYLGAQGITERAILPMTRDGRLFGVIGLYAQGEGGFDQAQLGLLNEMAADLEFALDSIAQNERRQVAEARAEISELRFREIFEASSAPMQIMSLATGETRALNRAHRQWLGYALEDIANTERWAASVYPDPEVRQQLMTLWQASIQEARTTGGVVHSPELHLRCKDGSDRIAAGTMTLVGDDAVLAWTDLTEIRRSEQALRASEQHFRGMIEQTVMGIYVRRGWKFIYVNPRFCEMVGWSPEELLGREIWEFTTSAPDNVARIQGAREKLNQGASSVHYVVAARCKNGELRELGLHANAIDWDGEPATIVMAEDITERNRAEAQIAQYVKQLEASMRGTLQAVSNMIDQRDPYTAGHERRVGLIAGAIGREMGWSEERCSRLEMVGLVHDIGKIGVPAEILTKPGRLTELETKLMREHAEVGYNILKDVPFPFPVAEIIRQHHERLDGSGYPRGLKGDEILPEARVLAVSDVIESISTHRPYRPARGLDVALQELERGRGTEYDPDVIDAFSRLLHDKGYTLPQ